MHLVESFRAAAATLWVAALSFAAAGAPPAGGGAEPVLSVNLHRVRVLLGGDVRAVWIGDSWSQMSNIERLPYGALATWPIETTAVVMGHKAGGLTKVSDYTDGPGALVEVNAGNRWEVETNGGSPAHFGLPVGDMTKAFGDAGLQLTGEDSYTDWIQSLSINNARFAETDGGPFSAPGQSFRCRMLYYAPADPGDLLPAVRLVDSAGTGRGTARLRDRARPKWHLGGNPDVDPPVGATPSQINAHATDVLLDESLALGPRLGMLQDPSEPISGSGDYWFFAGAVFYRAEGGERVPGYYHSGLAQNSWSFEGHAIDRESTGGKSFSDEQLRHWLDVTTIDRAQTPVVVVHLATEAKTKQELAPLVRQIISRYRSAFAAVGTAQPRFLLVGSYMHLVYDQSVEMSRRSIEELNSTYADLARTEPDCAFFSLYEATDGVFFTTDSVGGSGAQQAARDWLDAHGWSTITYGGVTYNLSSTQNGGLDGVLTADGIHLSASPAAAFYAKLLGDAIAASCPGDFNGDGAANSLDVLAFLNAWAARDPGADFNSDGLIDIRDALGFFNAWNEPCA